jgi:diguanylate cyclase (GGDEF)-like protein
MRTPLRVVKTGGRQPDRSPQTSPVGVLDLPSRPQFYHHLQQVMLTAQQRKKHLALLLMDLDHFRDVNANFGHQWGDVLLQQVGERLGKTLRRSDTVAHVGGDEFAVLLLDTKDEASVARVAKRVLSTVGQPFVIAGQTVEVRASIGIALYSQYDEDVHSLMRRAEVAMYVAKCDGNKYTFYSADQDRSNLDRLALKVDLRHAIDRNQLILYYQPQAHLATGHIAQVEALVRWQHLQHGLMLPDQFIPLAEQSNLIRPLSVWVFNAALQQYWAWQQEQLKLGLSVNLSMENLHDTGLPDTLAEMLRVWQVTANHLEVEITESVIAADLKRTTQVLARLKDLGLRIAIDDFGTGYSSLSYLKKLPVDTVKIDKSFIRNMVGDENDAAIVRSTIDLGHALGLKVVAEGVENKETYARLTELGCDFAQGNYLSHPLPGDEFSRWLHRVSLLTALRRF